MARVQQFVTRGPANARRGDGTNNEQFSPNPLQILFKISAIGCIDDAETDVITDARRGIWLVYNKLRANKVVYRMEDDQLMRLWSVGAMFRGDTGNQGSFDQV